MKMKKVLALVLIICLAMAAGVGATLAYLIDKDSATNTFTVGNVDIVLTEPNWVASGSKDAPEVYPGEALAKDPQVTNTGKNPCFVRIKVTGLDCLGTEGMIQYRTNYVVGALGADWELHTDGYFYYTNVLEVGKTTTALFDSIVIPTTATNALSDGSFNIVIDAYAVQAQGARPSFTAVKEMKAADIAAWFAVCAPEAWTK